MATPNLARYFINTDMEVLIRHQVQFIAVVMGKPAAFYEGMDMETAHQNYNISDRSDVESLIRFDHSTNKQTT